MTDAVFHRSLNAWTYEAFDALDLEEARSPSLRPTQISGDVDCVLIRLTGSFSYDADGVTGGGGRDVIAFRKGHGDDRITDFEIGRDIIEIGKGASKMSELSFARTGGDVLLSFANVTIPVENARVANLDSAGNFLF